MQLPRIRVKLRVSRVTAPPGRRAKRIEFISHFCRRRARLYDGPGSSAMGDNIGIGATHEAATVDTLTQCIH